MNVHAPHREYLAAIADGEDGLVPRATLDHVRDCRECQREVRAHKALSTRLRQLENDRQGQRVGLLRWVSVGVAAVLIVLAAGASWLALARPDPVQAAVNASSQPLQFESNDPTRVAEWCRQASGRSLPTIQLDG
ncbi:MAG TPA: hypothetical protein VHO95_07100, partial [Candidatus Dormibacteraeota bacterium]|nr:hypothetical protein [Candidatus Dormibacteraeota bacterium]